MELNLYLLKKLSFHLSFHLLLHLSFHLSFHLLVYSSIQLIQLLLESIPRKRYPANKLRKLLLH